MGLRPDHLVVYHHLLNLGKGCSSRAASCSNTERLFKGNHYLKDYLTLWVLWQAFLIREQRKRNHYLIIARRLDNISWSISLLTSCYNPLCEHQGMGAPLHGLFMEECSGTLLRCCCCWGASFLEQGRKLVGCPGLGLGGMPEGGRVLPEGQRGWKGVVLPPEVKEDQRIKMFN